MNYRLDVKITHKTFPRPMEKTFFYSGYNKADIMAQIDTLPCHIYNLEKHGRTAFKDTNGVKHIWKLTEIKEEIAS